MTSYEKIFKRFRGEVTDFSILNKDTSEIIEEETEILHTSLSDPQVRHLFSELHFDDLTQTLTYALKDSLDVYSDEEYVILMAVLGMKIAWYQPQIDSVVNIAPMIGGKEEKKILDNYSNTIKRLDSLKADRKRLIRDRGYLNNEYIREDN